MKLEPRTSEESVGTRDAILDATETIMRDEGYAAVSSRRVAEKAGLRSQLVHYHFGSMDELFVAIYERSEAEYLQRLQQALTSENPLRALWELAIHPKRTALALEMTALSNHRKSLRKQIAHTLDQMHAVQTAIITKYIADAGIDPAAYPPVIISYIIAGVSRSLATETALGFTEMHPEIIAFAERQLAELEKKRQVRCA
jgi:AcrR family transcriptional regulator